MRHTVMNVATNARYPVNGRWGAREVFDSGPRDDSALEHCQGDKVPVC